jgi:hypothetical protein
MAQLVTEKITVEVSRLARNGENLDPVASEELAKTLEEVIQQLVPPGSVVEVRSEHH